MTISINLCLFFLENAFDFMELSYNLIAITSWNKYENSNKSTNNRHKIHKQANDKWKDNAVKKV